MEKDTEKQILQLAPGQLELLDYMSSRFDVRVPLGVTPENLLDPAFWAHHGVKLKPFDEIRARCDDGTWVAYYIVLDCSRTWARVQLLTKYSLTTSDVSSSQASVEEFKAKHKIVHRGPHGWSVVREIDKAVLAQGMAVKDEAGTWLDKHARDAVGVPAPSAG
jgi:hypothetical protein